MNFEEQLFKMDCAPVIEGEFRSAKYYTFDFSDSNDELMRLDMNNREVFESYIDDKISKSNSEFGIGKYAEDRLLYKRFNLFETSNPRSFHLGIDIWKNAGTVIKAPLDGTVHGFDDNSSVGDYGPTIILEHKQNGTKFYTLYGHLNRDSLAGKKIGMQISKGEVFCALGDWEVNVNWPPHLHFQIIKDLMDNSGDFPGVCQLSVKHSWMENCPNPNLLLKLPGL